MLFRRREDLLKGVYAMGFTKPSRIQAKAFPIILKNPYVFLTTVGSCTQLFHAYGKSVIACRPGDLIAQSQSGTGKTAAFSLGMLSRVNPDEKWPQALCLSPTRELTRQTHDVVETMGKFTTIKVLEGVPGKRCMFSMRSKVQGCNLALSSVGPQTSGARSSRSKSLSRRLESASHG